jgi:asparagine synthetase B (glutamine-hydrolysing)
VAAIRLSPLEIASGLVLGEGRPRAPLAERGAGVTPRAALEQALLPLLERSPCLVGFSGGRDSSAILAVATEVSRHKGLPAPVPATIRFRDDPASEESRWQERVIQELGLEEWLRVEAGDQLGVLGPVATGAITRHGLLWPPNIHTLLPLLEAARGGSLITGLGGDELFAARPRLRRALLPVPVRRARLRRRASVDLPWLRTTARSALRSAMIAEESAEPVRWRRWAPWVARRRQFEILRESGDVLARDAGADLAHPMLDPGFLAALSGHRLHSRRAGRGKVLDHVLEGRSPEAVRSRTDKADFTRALWGHEARDFASTWSGGSPLGELVDAARLREVWSAERPDFRSATALQAAWLAEGSSGTLRRTGERLGAGAGIGK